MKSNQRMWMAGIFLMVPRLLTSCTPGQKRSRKRCSYSRLTLRKPLTQLTRVFSTQSWKKWDFELDGEHGYESVLSLLGLRCL